MRKIKTKKVWRWEVGATGCQVPTSPQASSAFTTFPCTSVSR